MSAEGDSPGTPHFAREFKESAARLVAEQRYTVPQAADGLGVDPGCIRDWGKKFAPPADQIASPSGESMISLRRENERLSSDSAIKPKLKKPLLNKYQSSHIS